MTSQHCWYLYGDNKLQNVMSFSALYVSIHGFGDWVNAGFPFLLVYRKGYREIDDEDNYLQRNDDASPSYYRYGSLPSQQNSLQEDSM